MSDQTFERKCGTRSTESVKQAEASMTDHQKTQKAFHENRERLKAARLARKAEFKGRENSRG